MSRRALGLVESISGLIWLGMAFLALGLPALAVSQQTPAPPPVTEQDKSNLPDAPEAVPDSASDPRSSGSIRGTVLDPSGAVVAGARIVLTREDQSPNQDVLSGDDGQFFFAHISAGPFHVTVIAEGFAPQASAGTVHSREMCIVPPIALAVATAVTEVRVGLTPAEVVEVAEAQIKDEEKQHVLGFIPNFYVTYVPDALPLTSKQKFELAWKNTIDPVTFVLVGVIAGIQQSQNVFPGYGQGAQGYAKRYGASYADLVVGTFLGSAILPSVLKQDPRYFYKGTGSKRSRILYALANSVICKGDNGHWQANYSSILGNLAAGGISNLYYPAKDRNGAGLTFESGAIGIGATGAANVIQEFLVKKLTPSASNAEAAKAASNKESSVPAPGGH